jgi:hypothetical protein
MSNIESFLKSVQVFLNDNKNQVSLCIGVGVLLVIYLLYHLIQILVGKRSKRKCKKYKKRCHYKWGDEEAFDGSMTSEKDSSNEMFYNHGSNEEPNKTHLNEMFYNHNSTSNEDHSKTPLNETFYNTDDVDEYYNEIKDEDGYAQTADVVKETIDKLEKDKELLEDNTLSKSKQQKIKKSMQDNKQILHPLININKRIKDIQENPSIVVSDIKLINKNLVKATLSIKCGMYKKEIKKATDTEAKTQLSKAVEKTQATIDILNDADNKKKDVDLKQKATIIITTELAKISEDNKTNSLRDKINNAKLDIIVEPKILENKLKEKPDNTSLANKLDIAITKADILVKGETPQNKEDGAKAFVVLKEQTLKTTNPNSEEHNLYKEKCKSIVDFEKKVNVNSAELTKINTLLSEEITQNKSILEYLKENNKVNQALLSKIGDLSEKLNKKPDLATQLSGVDLSTPMTGFDNNLVYAEFKV